MTRCSGVVWDVEPTGLKVGYPCMEEGITHVVTERGAEGFYCRKHTPKEHPGVAALRAEVERLRAMGEKVNAIRNSIVGTQALNWSEHAYPLVAALDEAGFVGMSYPEGREHFGTLIERTVKAEAEVERLRGLIAEAEWRGRDDSCPWCYQWCRTHRDDCPAFSARGEVRR